MEHKCTKEQEITSIHSMVLNNSETLIRIDNAIRGNGRPGIMTDMAVLKNRVIGLIGLNVILIGGLLSLWFVK